MLTQNMYSIIVLTAIVTSLMAPLLLRWTLGHVEMGDEERERLEAEERQRGSFVGNLKRVLVPLTGGTSSRLAARLVGLVVADQDVEVTAMHVRHVSEDGESRDEEVEAELGQIESHLNLPKSHLRRVLRNEEGALVPVVRAEAEKGYDLLVIGTTGQGTGAAGPVADHDEEAIVERESNVDLIVMASSQSQVSQRAFLGYLVDYVVRHASCPVVVVGMP